MESLTVHARKHLAATTILQKVLLFCGMLSAVLYIVLNIVCASLYDGYDVASQTVSELSAIDAPTRPLWVSWGIVYSFLVMAFGIGVWNSAGQTRPLRTVAVLLFVDGFIGLFWPPMHQREVLAAGGATWTDTLHIVFTFVSVPLMMLAIGFGAAALGKSFRWYSFITLLILVIAGIFTGLQAPNISSNGPTPWIGIWERINIGVYMIWMVVLAVLLLHKQNIQYLTDVPD